MPSCVLLQAGLSLPRLVAGVRALAVVSRSVGPAAAAVTADGRLSERLTIAAFVSAVHRAAALKESPADAQVTCTLLRISPPTLQPRGVKSEAPQRVSIAGCLC